jgi:hypothetical protein
VEALAPSTLIVGLAEAVGGDSMIYFTSFRKYGATFVGKKAKSIETNTKKTL